jgi:cell division topological specificity factor
MKDFINKLLGKPIAHSKNDAKKRLKFLLIHDQVDLTPVQLDAMKEEILEVIARYVDVDAEDSSITLERGDRNVALVSSITVRRVVERAAAATA